MFACPYKPFSNILSTNSQLAIQLRRFLNPFPWHVFQISVKFVCLKSWLGNASILKDNFIHHAVCFIHKFHYTFQGAPNNQVAFLCVFVLWRIHERRLTPSICETTGRPEDISEPWQAGLTFGTSRGPHSDLDTWQDLVSGCPGSWPNYYHNAQWRWQHWQPAAGRRWGKLLMILLRSLAGNSRAN